MPAVGGLGSNALRADEPKRFSDARILVGNWPDDRKHPDFIGTRLEIKTMYQDQLAQTTGTHLPYFGATLASQNPQTSAFEQNIDYSNLTHYRKDYNDQGWASMTTTNMWHRGTVRPDEYGSENVSVKPDLNSLTFGMADPSTLDTYRKRWLHDNEPKLRTQRFTSAMSEAFSGPNVPRRFVGTVERFLPGTVKALDFFKDKVTTLHGIDGILVLAQSFTAAEDEAAKEGMTARAGSGGAQSSMVINPARAHLAVADPRGTTKLSLRAHLETVIKLHLKIDLETELFDRFLDIHSSNRANPEALISALRGHDLNERRLAAVSRAWAEIQELTRMRRNGSHVTVKDVRTVFDATYHPDVRRKPIALRTPSAVSSRLVAGLAAVLRMHGALAYGEAPLTAPVSKAVDEVLGACEVAAGVDPIVLHSTTLHAALDSCEVPQSAWEDYCVFISAAIECDDAFTRVLDGCWHVQLKPVLTACEPVYRESAQPRKGGGMTTAAGDCGSGLRFASSPYVPGRPIPVPPPSKLDLDAVVTKTGGATHVALLVTHADGHKSMQTLVRDRFMDVKDSTALLARLTSAGLKDAVAVAADF